MSDYVGKVLIAHPNLNQDEPFHRTVIYIYQHDPEKGTIGVITNKKSRFSVADLAADKNIPFGDTSKFLYHGGPVNQQALVMLHTDDWTSSNTAPAGRKLCVSSDEFMIEKLSTGNEPAHWRMFGGMAAWGPGQLEAELSGTWPYRSENSWLIAKAPEQLLFGTDGDKQWQKCFEISSAQMFAQYW
jgi:putative transcriptional regulator